MSDREKDVEILILRHQIAVLERRLGGDRLQFGPEDRAFLAALLVPLPREFLRRLRLLVRPDALLRSRRDLLRQSHARTCRPRNHPNLAHSAPRNGQIDLKAHQMPSKSIELLSPHVHALETKKGLEKINVRVGIISQRGIAQGLLGEFPQRGDVTRVPLVRIFIPTRTIRARDDGARPGRVAFDGLRATTDVPSASTQARPRSSPSRQCPDGTVGTRDHPIPGPLGLGPLDRGGRGCLPPCRRHAGDGASPSCR